MAKDIITRLKLDASQHNQGLSKAKQSLERYAQGAYSIDSVVKGLIGTFGKYVGAIGLATTAMNTLKDAFMKNETLADEFGQTMEVAKSSYDGFLVALNNGDISGFLKNMEDIVNAAREAYDAMDELGTFQAFNQVNSARNKAGYAKALEQYKLNPTAENKKVLEDANKKVIQDLKDEAKKSQTAYKESLESIALNQGLKGDAAKRFVELFQNKSYQDLINAKKDYQELGYVESAKQGYWGNKILYKGKQIKFDGGRAYEVTGANGSIDTNSLNTQQDEIMLARALTQFGDDKIKEIQQVGAQAYNLMEAAAQQERSFNRLAGNNGGGGKTPTHTTPTKEEPILPEGSIAELTKQIKDYREQQNLATNNNDWQTLQTNIDATQAKIDEIVGKVKEIKPDPTALSADWFKSMQIDTSDMAMGTQQFFDAQQINADWQMLQDSLDGTPLTLGVDITEEEWTDFLTRINEKLAELGIAPINIPINAKPVEEAGKVALTAEQHAQGAAKAFSAIGNALSQIDDPGAKVAGLVATAIGNIAATFAASLKGTMTPWDWIAGAVSGAATMITTIAAIKSATAGAYADGGVIGGNSYVGDRLYARVNSGETILNQDQAQRALDMMDGSPVVGGSGGNSTISGEQIVTVINAYGRRTGRGEILQ